MIARTARAWARDVARMARPAVRAGVGRAGDPARIADDDRPAVAGDGLPRAARRDPPALASCRPRSASVAPGEDLRVARRSPAAGRPAASSAARSSRPRGTPPGAWSLPPIGPRPSRLGTPMPGGRVRVRRAAGRRCRATSKPSASRHAPGRARPAGRCARASPSATSAPSRSNSTVVSGTSVASAISRIAASAGLERLARRSARTSTSSVQRSATTFGRVPPAMTPTLTVTPGQRPLSACRSRDDPGRLEDRAAALLGLDAGVGRPAVDGDPQVEDPLARRHDVAVGAGALEDERDVGVARRSSRMCGVDVGEPISSSGLAMNDEPLERQAAALGDDRLERVEAGQQARLHVGHARAVGDAVLDPERALGGGPRVEDRVHVADQQRRAAPPGRPSNVATTVSPRRPAGSGRRSTVGAELGQERRDPAADLVDAGRRVAPAVDVDEPLEVGEVGRQVGGDRAAQGVELGGRRAIAAASVAASMAAQSRPLAPCYPARTVRLVEIRLLEGPNVYRLEPVVKLEVAVGRRRTWYGQRDPGRHALVRLGADVPARDWPDRDRRDRRLDPAPAGRPRRGPRRARRPSLVRPGALDRHVPVDRRGAGPDARPRRRSPSPSATSRRRATAQLTGAQERLLARWTERIAGGPDDAAGLDPRRRPARSRSCRSRARTARAR